MKKLFGIAVLVAMLFAMAEATRIKFSFGVRDNTFASSMNLKPACKDLKEVDQKHLEKVSRYYALIKNRPEVKFYISKTALDQLGLALNKQLPGTENTAGDFLEEVRKSGCPTYIFGGAVRDTLLGLDSKDIDVETDCKSGKIIQLCKKKFGGQLCHQRGQLINFGSQQHVAQMVDMASTSQTFYGSKNHLEYSPNALAFDYGGENVIIALCGTAVIDACNKQIRIPAQDWDAWATIRKNDQGKKIFRYWKLKAKGFKPYNDATEEYIVAQAVEYIKNDGWLAMKKYYCSIMYGNNWVKRYIYYRYGHKYYSEGCDISKEACDNTNIQEKAKHFKAIIHSDLKWQLPTCGE